jgi:hypothetical protein
MEDANQRGKRILGNTPKVGPTRPAKGGGLWKRWASVVKGGGERPAAGWAKKVGWPAGLIRKKIERF